MQNKYRLVDYVCLGILVLCVNSNWAQRQRIYMNDDLEEISHEEFLSDRSSGKNHKYYNLTFDMGPSIVKVKVLKEKKGQISVELYQQLKQMLHASSNQVIGVDDIIIIFYNNDLPECGNKYLENKYLRKFKRRVKRKKNIKHFFMYKKDKMLNESCKYDINFIADTDELIKDNFFRLKYPYSSLLIDGKGNYFAIRTEHSYKYLLKLIKDENTFKN